MEEKNKPRATEASSAVSEKDKEQPAEKPKEKLTVRLARELYDYAEIMVFAAIVVLLICSHCFRLCTVRGGSMEQTMYEGECLLVSNICYEPEIGDILIFHQTSDTQARFNEPIVKRVIATERQWIDIDQKSGRVTVYDENFENPQVLDESAYRYLEGGSWDSTLYLQYPVQVPEDHVFVMGDNRNNSADSSTSDVIGFVDHRRILGRVLCRLTPFSKFGPVE